MKRSAEPVYKLARGLAHPPASLRFSAKQVTWCLRVPQRCAPSGRRTCPSANGHRTAGRSQPLLPRVTQITNTTPSSMDTAAESNGKKKSKVPGQEVLQKSRRFQVTSRLICSFFWSKSCFSATLKMQTLINSYSYTLQRPEEATCFCRWHL